MITQERLKDVLHYDPETGIFTWIKPTSPRVKAGMTAGCIAAYPGRKTYILIGLDGTLYQAHRLAWLYIHGSFPLNEIDHIDGSGANNKIINLRDVTASENSRNARLYCTNKSGVGGVSFCKYTGTWRAMIWINNVATHISRHKDKFDAICARKSAENKYNYHPNHGQVRPL